MLSTASFSFQQREWEGRGGHLTYLREVDLRAVLLASVNRLDNGQEVSPWSCRTRCGTSSVATLGPDCWCLSSCEGKAKQRETKTEAR